MGGSAAAVGGAAGVVPEEEGCFSVSSDVGTLSVGCGPVEGGALMETDCALVALYGGAVVVATDDRTLVELDETAAGFEVETCSVECDAVEGGVVV